MDSKNKVIRFVIILLSTAILAGLIGFNLSNQKKSNPSSSPKPSSGNGSNLRVGPPSIIKNQQATAIAEITKFDDKTVTLKGDDGKQETYKLGGKVVVYDPARARKAAEKNSSPSAKVSAVAGKEALRAGKAFITMDMLELTYFVNTVSYFEESR